MSTSEFWLAEREGRETLETPYYIQVLRFPNFIVQMVHNGPLFLVLRQF